MPIYSLWRERDDTTFDGEEARDAAHAVDIFSHKLGVELTLDEVPAGPPYMMRLVERHDPMNPCWAKAPDIPVWVKGPTPSN